MNTGIALLEDAKYTSLCLRCGVSFGFERADAAEISVWGTVSPASSGIFTLALTVDLGGLQTDLTPMLAAELNRSDRCGERLTLEKAVLAPEAPAGMA